jgi:glycosyltransferase involved in cell wall biosynthesis
MHAADIAIHPSRGEAHCLAILEYMDAGLPVVVPDTRSVSQDVTDGANGLVFPAEDADAAASAVLRLANDGPLRARMGEHGRQLVRSRFTLEAVNARFLAAIEGQL